MRRRLDAKLFVSLLAASIALAGPVHLARAASPGASDSPLAGLPETVTLTREQLKNGAIRVGHAERGAAQTRIKAPATVRFARDDVAKIGPRLPAKVVKATVHLGDAVNAGDTVAILESVELGKVKANYLNVRSRLDLARKKYQREKRLVAQKISSRATLEQARAAFEQARAELDSSTEELRLYGLSRKAIENIHPGTDEPFSRYRLTTPQAGVVEKMDITPGESLTPEMTPIEVVDPTRMWVMIDAFEKDVGRIKDGQKVLFEPRALPDRQFTGKVEWIARELSPTTRTLKLRATVPNPEGILRAGMFGNAFIRISGDKDANGRAVLPADAIQTVNGSQIVFKPVAGSPGTFSVAVVRTGADSGDRVEIVSGVSPGEPVVVDGSFALMAILTAATRQDTD